MRKIFLLKTYGNKTFGLLRKLKSYNKLLVFFSEYFVQRAFNFTQIFYTHMCVMQSSFNISMPQ